MQNKEPPLIKDIQTSSFQTRYKKFTAKFIPIRQVSVKRDRLNAKT